MRISKVNSAQGNSMYSIEAMVKAKVKAMVKASDGAV